MLDRTSFYYSQLIHNSYFISGFGAGNNMIDPYAMSSVYYGNAS